MAYHKECGVASIERKQFCENCDRSVVQPSEGTSAEQDGNNIDDLKKSLIYRMSNGSHELFHSNVLAWMLEQCHDFAEVFFKELKGKDYAVFREKHHMDIVLEFGGKSYVIENKFKSLPGAYQLERYQQAFRKGKATMQFGGGALLGVHDQLRDQLPTQWHYVDYQTIAEYIKNPLNADVWRLVDSFAKATITQYGSLISQLTSILKKEVNWRGERMPRPSDFAAREGVQLRDLCKKIQVAVFAKHLSCDVKENELDQYAKEKGFNFKITTSFLRGDAILEIRFFRDRRDDKKQKKDDNWGAECTIGLEVHADKYIWFVKCGEHPEDIVKMLWDKKWFTNDPSRTTVTGRRQKEDGLYSFGEGFHYQYLPLTHKQDFAFNSLSERIRSKLNEMKDLLIPLGQILD